MKILFKALYDFVVDQFTLFENPFWNYVIAAIVGTIAFSIAWNLVGRLYDAGDIHGDNKNSCNGIFVSAHFSDYRNNPLCSVRFRLGLGDSPFSRWAFTDYISSCTEKEKANAKESRREIILANPQGVWYSGEAR